MSQKYISNPYEETVEKNYVFFDIEGKSKAFSLTTDQPDMQIISQLSDLSNCCYSVMSSNKESYFIKFEAGMAFNPLENSNSYRSRLWKWKRVTKSSFNNYLKFLQTKEVRLLRVIERLL
jgi:hypothetical protein